ncbi:MAG: universal stress protein [Planctomycetes bacterium]|nr:universal stress protein [Planctomycetota bacterium]
MSTELLSGTVIVPVDFSDESFAAVDVAIDISGDDSRVTVVHVLPSFEHYEHDLLFQEIDHAKRRNHAEEALRRRFDSSEYGLLKVKVSFGDPGQRIADAAEVRHAGMIVMPSHGRTGLQRVLLGSVAERVIRLAHCPVLVLRDNNPALT